MSIAASNIPPIFNIHHQIVSHLPTLGYPRGLNLDAMASVISRLDPSHRSVLEQAISNILDTDLALLTMAQIMDGLPLDSVAWDRSRHKLHSAHPITHHTQLCPGSMDSIKTIKASFRVESLTFHSSLLDAFQSARPQSRAFHLRLIELTAVAIHQIAVYLFQLGETYHDPATTHGADIAAVTQWEPEPCEDLVRVEPWPTLFTHRYFDAYNKYPEGVADMVGYWAEDRILGGVALFDRSRAWDSDQDAHQSEVEPNTYFQSCRKHATWRVWQLLDEQQEQLVDFLLATNDTTHVAPSDSERVAGRDGPLPFMDSRANTVRMAPGDAIEVNKIYRDIWERQDPSPYADFQRERAPCVTNSDDYPEMEDTGALIRELNGKYR